MSLSIGKWRRLQQTASPEGTFCVLAIDHRGPLRRALQQESPEIDVEDVLTSLKEDVTRSLGPVSTAVLLDPETGAGPCVASGALSGQTALIVAMDRGSSGDPAVRETGLVEGWSVEKAARMGAAGVKLLIYYHPDSAEARTSEQLVSTIAQECVRHEIAFFLEPLSCSPDEQRRSLPSAERCEVVIETARRLVPLGVDVLKAEFPVDAAEVQDEGEWSVACQQLSAACAVPWVLLSAGVSFDTFLRQARIACDAGASGVMVGRAVWKEAVTGEPLVRDHFLNRIGRERMRRLRTLCDALGRPFAEIHTAPETGRDWYSKYGSSGNSAERQ